MIFVVGFESVVLFLWHCYLWIMERIMGNQEYMMIDNNLFLSLKTGLIHHCASGSDIFELLRLARPFEMKDEDTEKRKAAEEVAV